MNQGAAIGGGRRPGATTRLFVWEATEGRGPRRVEDVVITEEPLEIRLVSDVGERPVAVTMRTPGSDFELATGFLFSEGILKDKDQLRGLSYCIEGEVPAEQRFNIVKVLTRGLGDADLAILERHFSVTSACGVCGKATIDGLRKRGLRPCAEGVPLRAEAIGALPGKLRQGQELFAKTGGLHAAGLFTPGGDLVAVREDVGRHNAMDKLVGWAFLERRLPLEGYIVAVSGRSSYELVQKSVSAGVAALCSVSAPSTLAIELAREFGLTLAGFVRDGRFKIYSCPDRVTYEAAS